MHACTCVCMCVRGDNGFLIAPSRLLTFHQGKLGWPHGGRKNVNQREDWPARGIAISYKQSFLLFQESGDLVGPPRTSLPPLPPWVQRQSWERPQGVCRLTHFTEEGPGGAQEETVIEVDLSGGVAGGLGAEASFLTFVTMPLC